MPTTSLYSVHFASLCFHRKSIFTSTIPPPPTTTTTLLHPHINFPLANRYATVCVPPGVQLKGRLQVQDVFEEVTEIKDGNILLQ